MATIPSPAAEGTSLPADFATSHESPAWWLKLQQILRPAASLKLTIVLMAAAIAIIFIGTLAQTEMDIWEVMHIYFRSWFVVVPLRVFFPKSFFPPAAFTPPGGAFPFPGGATIGLLMAINLLAAHLVRFKSQARDRDFWIGWSLIAVAFVLAFVVVFATVTPGSDAKWGLMWYAVLLMLAATCVGSWVYSSVLLVQPFTPLKPLLSVVFSKLALITSAMLVYSVAYPQDARLSDSSLRILWQVSQGGFAALVMLLGCWFVFKQRAGIVLMHGGIAMLMLGEALVAYNAVESQITLREGETANFSRDIRTTELAFIEQLPGDKDDVIVVRRQALETSAANKSLIRHADLPVDIVVKKYFPSAQLRELKKDETSLADQGLGKTWLAEAKQASTGTDMDSKVDFAAAYVQLQEKGTGKDLGTYLCSVLANEVDDPEQVEIGGKKYQLALRFKHIYKNYEMTLKDVQKTDYPGTTVPRDYSSYLVLNDKVNNVSLNPHIWMNNPLRYGGETFYQSGYNNSPEGESTTIQVVSNTGWMMPYVSLSFVTLGMLFHFWLTLTRFVEKAGRGIKEVATQTAVAVASSAPSKSKRGKEVPALLANQVEQRQLGLFDYVVPAVFAVLFLAFIASVVREKKQPAGEFDLAGFGRLPIVQDGRVKPLDTLARNSLKIISNEETFKDAKGKRQPAIRWLLDVISGRPEALEHKIFRIENIEVISLFDQQPRPGFFRYSAKELQPKILEFEKIVKQAEEKDKLSLSIYEKKILELNERLKHYMILATAFDPPSIPEPPSPQAVQADRSQLMNWMTEFRSIAEMTQRRVDAMKIPLVIPVSDPEKNKTGLARDGWQAYPTAYLGAYIQSKMMGEDPDAGVMLMNSLLDSYSKDKVVDFNKTVIEYQRQVIDARAPTFYNASKIRFERFFNTFMPFFWSIWLYLVAFVIATVALMTQWRPLRNSATLLIVLIFALHTFALVARIWISGRPPVTNLYSSAVFIGWGCVMFGLIIEAVSRKGLGNIVAAAAGFKTLLIAWFLALDGDTFTVLQAVLDTQIWLATHVTSITLGYSATFLAGLLGVIVIAERLAAFATNSKETAFVKTTGTMIYGTLCFALFFSFVGTVLGGLWADDSWGRFWGWDPKENGALMIVLWNALVLHARWDRLIAERGMAILAVLGNVVTAWSWFGVNELGVGLHSYGFTEGRLMYLALVIGIHLIIVLVGVLEACLAKAAHSQVGSGSSQKSVPA